MGLFNDWETGEDVMNAINKAFEDGTYAGALRIYPHIRILFENIDATRRQVELIKNTAEDTPIECPQEKAIRKLSYRIRDMLNDVIRSYKYPTISEIPSGLEMELLAGDMKKLDEILHIVEEAKNIKGEPKSSTINGYFVMPHDKERVARAFCAQFDNCNKIESEDKNMKEDITKKDVVKETMQESINACNNSIKLDDLGPADDEPGVNDKDNKICKACDVICDIGLAITAASTIALAVKATKVKKATGKYNPVQLVGCAIDGYILGKNTTDVVLYMPNTVTSKVAKKLTSTAKKVASKAIKSIRKEVE